jgi:hypothetical protein
MTSIFFIYLSIFLAITGVMAILKGLSSKEGEIESTSNLEFRGFKVSGPISFVYGILALASVSAIVINWDVITSNHLGTQKNETQIIQSPDLDFLTVKFDAKETISIFKGEITLKGSGIGNLVFNGVVGVYRKLDDAAMIDNQIKVDAGDKFFIVRKSGSIWAVNVLHLLNYYHLEFYEYQE